MKRKYVAVTLALMLALSPVAASAEAFIGQITGARTTQSFTDEAVDEADLSAIVQAGLSATSAMNLQPWFFAVVTNGEIMREISGGEPSATRAGVGSSPVAIVVYADPSAGSRNADFDCGLACQNMFMAANALGYGAKIVSSPTIALNGDGHDGMCEKLGVDKSLRAVAVLLIGHAEGGVDATSGATARQPMDDKVSFVK